MGVGVGVSIIFILYPQDNCRLIYNEDPKLFLLWIS